MAGTPTKPVIGLEIHIQLATESKMFSAEAATYGQPPNTVVSPVSLAYPGTLPVLNRQALEFALRMGLACGCSAASVLSFTRKNYFYHDLPKGYQITQEDNPLCTGGSLQYIGANRQIQSLALRRMHLEEDTARSVHDNIRNLTMLDFNRAGTPLLEVVTEPALECSHDAAAVVAHIRRLVRYLGISDGNMENGSLRCDVNVSLQQPGEPIPENKVEIKNLNSVEAVKNAVEDEVLRQRAVLIAGGAIFQESRVFIKEEGRSYRMRNKESLEDYRYFPEPDLPPVALDHQWIEHIAGQLPDALTDWYVECREKYGLQHAEALQLLESAEDARYYREIMKQVQSPRKAYFIVRGPVRKIADGKGTALSESGIAPSVVALLVDKITEGSVDHSMAVNEILPELAENPAFSLEDLLARKKSERRDAGVLRCEIRALRDQYPDKVLLYREGKKGIADMFVGMIMRIFKGHADPKTVRNLVIEVLEEKPAD